MVIREQIRGFVQFVGLNDNWPEMRITNVAFVRHCLYHADHNINVLLVPLAVETKKHKCNSYMRTCRPI